MWDFFLGVQERQEAEHFSLGAKGWQAMFENEWVTWLFCWTHYLDGTEILCWYELSVNSITLYPEAWIWFMKGEQSSFRLQENNSSRHKSVGQVLNLWDSRTVFTAWDVRLSTDDYQCCGSLDVDFPEVCALLGMTEIPAVTQRKKTAASQNAEQSTMGKNFAITHVCLTLARFANLAAWHAMLAHIQSRSFLSIFSSIPIS